jgi:hypothetical protein
MDSEREVKCLAAVWALRGILTPQGFKDFKLKDGLISWDQEELEELLDYLKSKETPATVKLLSANSLSTLEKGMDAVTLTRTGVFFQNLAQLGDLLHLTEAERDILLFALLFQEEAGLRQALHELKYCSTQELYGHLSCLRYHSPSLKSLENCSIGIELQVQRFCCQSRPEINSAFRIYFLFQQRPGEG